MAGRPKQSLMDYMVIGISPALIMAMVGSLLYFLVAVFYHGQHSGRMYWIFALFTMAIVLIARISMERGVEYASLFAIPLALVTMLAMSRFVQIQGQLADYSVLINFGLIGIVWWSAHKLTWDCTLIDDKEDSSGEGLLQGLGFDEETVDSQATDQAVESSGESAEAEQDREGQAKRKPDSGVPLWWQRMVDRRHRPHTPGVWVVYYGLAALPLFAVGQWLIPAADTGARLWAFKLLVVYVASALGLLLTTSFLGLRRYLRQRKLEMPLDMAGIWLGIGAAMIIALLIVSVVLPRPGAAVSISQFPISFGSPGQQRTNKNALGNDGPEDAEKATRTRSDAKESGAQAPTQKDGKGPPKGAQKNGTAKSGSSKGSSSQQGKGKQSGSDSQQSNNSQKSGGSSEKGEPGKSGDTQSQAGKQNDSSQGSGKQDSGQSKSGDGGAEQGKSNDPQGKSSDEQQGAKQARSDANAKRSRDAGSKTGEPRKPDNRSKQGKGSDQRSKSGTGKRNEDSSSDQPQRESRSASDPPSSSGVMRAVSGLFANLGGLIKLLFWAVLLGIVIYFGWKHRERIALALKQLWDDLKNFLATLFGNKRDKTVADDEEAGKTVAESFKPFSSYINPFATGRAGEYSTEQLVRHTFEAMEAWARERGSPRDEEETPLEFARKLAIDHPQMGVEAQQLADLYSRVAYGRQRVKADRQTVLADLWQHMHSTASMPVPPARGTAI